MGEDSEGEEETELGSVSKPLPRSDREKVMSKKFPTSLMSGKDLEDKYAEAWYELGEPIFIPFIKFLIAVSLFLIDNFFLVKNTYNAITLKDDPDRPDDAFNEPQIIAACILGMHIFSSCLISIIDSLNKDAILGQRGKYLNRKHKSLMFFRFFSHLTLTMRLFRYITSYLENRRRNKQLHSLRWKRAKVSEREVQFVVDQKKNQLVESHYDLVDSFFKTVPAALLQVFFMFKANPNAKLRLYTATDMDRFATVFFCVLTSSISAANYQTDYLAYKKVLMFQDCFRSNFNDTLSLTIPGNAFLASNLVVQFATIGIRMCFYGILIFWSPSQFLLIMSTILFVNFILTFFWNKSAWRFRPVLENPLYGTPWPSFDLIDLWINLFVPGVHYAKPLDHFLNFYTTTVTGIVIFQSIDFLYPSKTRDPPKHKNATSVILNTTNVATTSDALHHYLNASSAETLGGQEAETFFLITSIIKGILSAHELLTFSEISYAGFFYNIVKFMNVVNFFCFIYTCIMNWLSMYDLDFPFQIVNSFYVTIFNHLSQNCALQSTEGKEKEYGPFLKPHGQCEVLLIYSLLRNSSFFYNVPTVRWLTNNWQTIPPEHLEELVAQLIREGKQKGNENDHLIIKFMDKVADISSPFLYPPRFREPKLNWDVESEDKDAILDYLEGHPLQIQITKFVDQLHSHLNEDGKLLLAVFCANYNEIVRNYTSLRLKRTFEFLNIPIEKGDPHTLRTRNASSSGNNNRMNDYEMNYFQRILREARGKAESIFI